MAGPSDMGTLGSFTYAATVTVGTTSVNILPDQKRVLHVIVNTSTGGQVITLSFGRVAIAGVSGVVLNPGQAWVESNGEGFECYQGPIQAIANGAGGSIGVSSR